MASRLVNVRLDDDRARKVDALRERGVSLSDVVRQAIDERFSALHRTGARRDVEAIVGAILQKYPDPPGMPPRRCDVHDPKAARAAIRRRLRRPRP